MKTFTIIQKIRNKVRIKGSVDLNISSNAKIANCDISIKGKNNSLVISDKVTVRHTQIEILGDNCSIFIGENCIIGHDCYLSAKEGKSLIIKEECMLSRNVKLMTSDGHYIYKNDEIINYGLDITIENNVWLADNVTILKGVNIGSNSVIAINSTVTKNVPANSIAAGNPAKVVKEDVDWKR